MGKIKLKRRRPNLNMVKICPNNGGKCRKTIKVYLKEFHGIECNSPKGCIREYFTRRLLTEEETIKLLEMVEYRNLTSHTYEEVTAEEIFERLPEFLELREKAISRMN